MGWWLPRLILTVIEQYTKMVKTVNRGKYILPVGAPGWLSRWWSIDLILAQLMISTMRGLEP